MQQNKELFMTTAFIKSALMFGNFKLKSGIDSNVFFNIAKFNDGKSLNLLAECYAFTIVNLNLNFDMIFGPAYKGIHIAALTSEILWRKYNRNYPVAFNRKEEKTHGEGGSIIGASIQGNVLIIDDVLTKGTAIKQAINIVRSHKAHCTDAIVAVDREEISEQTKTSITIYDTLNVAIHSICTLSDIRKYSKEKTHSV